MGSQGLVTRAEPVWADAGPDDVLMLQMLPTFAVREAEDDLPLSRAAQRLVVFLALRDHPVRRAEAAHTLWGEASGEHSAASLRTTLWRVGQVHRGLVRATPEWLSLADTVAVDVRAASGLARSLAAHGELPADSAPVAGLLATDLLPVWCDDWLFAFRERWRQLRLHALERLAERLAAQRRFVEAVDVALTAIDGEPLRESAHRSLIRVHLLEGNHGEAIRVYRALVRLLRTELGVAPSPGARALLGEIRPAQ
ncbi:AfsR/SARP family transcriptional regulator [Amycolatopsis sulphurea]|uniref:AfsR/SARP family transcriptional regulator n=1 Tax=Amycolatopsis sulphurea TaxID=76022 RepID=UPI001145A191|nr:BTAD domain-containing putative transcriptional regulator [Amycolatopsis sulphurea]